MISKIDLSGRGYIFCSDYPSEKSCRVGVVERKRCSENDSEMYKSAKNDNLIVPHGTLSNNPNGEKPDDSSNR